MACINVHMEDVVGSCLSATISRIGNGISARTHNLCQSLRVSTTDSEKHLAVRCSIVCTLSEAIGYISVTPKDIQWITDDMGVFYDVESNIDWIIVTS